MLLRDKVALVTGASSGIGRATTLLFAKEGARVMALGRNKEALQQVIAEIQAAEGQAALAVADVTSAEDCKRALDSTLTAYGRLDVLVNAAGIIGSGSLADTTPKAWRHMLEVNLDSVFLLMQMALPHLEKSQGNIVNVSSVTGVRAFPGVLAYCVSKAGVDQLTRCAALELAPKGIRVNAVNPGVVVTNLHRRGGMQEDKYATFLEHSRTTHPIGRVGNPEEVAEAILFLASEKSAWTTGVTLSIDGGRQLTCAR